MLTDESKRRAIEAFIDESLNVAERKSPGKLAVPLVLDLNPYGDLKIVLGGALGHFFSGGDSWLSRAWWNNLLKGKSSHALTWLARASEQDDCGLFCIDVPADLVPDFARALLAQGEFVCLFQARCRRHRHRQPSRRAW